MSLTMPNSLASTAQTLNTQLCEALDWATRSSHPDIANNHRLQKDIRRSIFQVKRLEKAASSKMCVGVYGASQAGKSYLVSVLAKRENTPLTAVFGERHIDFIRHINPEGGKESTGLVTRFTMDKVNSPADFPIKAKLLSELDLVKVFVNSYLNDILPDENEDIEMHESHVAEVLGSLENLPHSMSPLNLEDVYDLEEYCTSKSLSNIRFQALKRVDFWSRASALLPKLGEDSRVKLVELLWEGIPSFTRSYRLLTAELRRLSYPDHLFCAASALFDEQHGEWKRGVNSIINVSTLHSLGLADSGSVDVMTDSGSTFSVPIGTLCGLISELVIQLKEKPHDFFDCTDLLDFPGARSRHSRQKDSNSSIQLETFLRGKVAYLFDKYSSDLELSAMLLCVGPSNQEVVGLAKLVEDWVERTHGKTPEEREKLPTALFLILTKFDQEFSQGAGRTTDGTRWATRLQASLLEPFGAHCQRTGWVKRWDSRGAFRNTYWLRNTNVDQLGLIQYEGEIAVSKELGFAPERIGHISLLRQEFVNHPLVREHFQNPSDAWEAGMQLNDGGIQYLVKGLTAICQPGFKARQVQERLYSLAISREQDLRKYYVSGNKKDVIQEKRLLAEKFLHFGGNLFMQKRLGEFINFLLLSDRDTQDIFRRVEIQYEREKNSSRKTDTQAESSNVKIDDDLAQLLGLNPEIKPFSNIEKASEPVGDLPDRFVMNLFYEWISSVTEKASAGNVEAYLHLDRDLLTRLLHEIEHGAKRTGLVDSLKQIMRSNYQYKPSNPKGWMLQQTSVLTGLFNQFLIHGGCAIDDDLKPVKIEKLDGTPISIFIPRQEVTQIEIPDLAEDFSKAYFIDWLQAVQFTIRENAEFIAQQSGDTPSNRELGDLLRQLSATSKSMSA